MLFLKATVEFKSQVTAIIYKQKNLLQFWRGCMQKKYLVCLMPSINSSSLFFSPKRACQSEGFEDLWAVDFPFLDVFSSSSSDSSSHPNSALNRSRCSTLTWKQWIVFEENNSSSRHNQQPRQYQRGATFFSTLYDSSVWEVKSSITE